MRIKLITISLGLLVYLGAATTGAAQTSTGAESKAATAPSLSEAQKQSLMLIGTESEKKAAPLAMKLATTVKKIYENMLAENRDEALRQSLSKEMDEIVVQLLHIKGQSMWDAANVLNPAQKQLVKAEMAKPGAPGDMMEVIVRTFKLSEK